MRKYQQVETKRGNEGESIVHIWGTAFQAEGTDDKNGKAEMSLDCLKSSKNKEEERRGRRQHWISSVSLNDGKLWGST